MTILDEIGRRKRWEGRVLRDALRGHLREQPGVGFMPAEEVLAEAGRFLKAGGCERPQRRPWEAALAHADELRVIAEVKRRSPSAGSFATWTDPAELASVYEAGGAAAVSCLTDAEFFDGRPAFLARCREVFSGPVLRKDFLLDELDVAVSAALGADAILLIVSMLGPRTQAMIKLARCYDLGVLVEVHDGRELEIAMAAGSPVLGINNRDLRTFRTDLAATERLTERIPPGIVIVGESGIKGPKDAVRMRRAGCHAILVGESLARGRGDGLEAMRIPGARGNAGSRVHGSKRKSGDEPAHGGFGGVVLASGLVLPTGFGVEENEEPSELRIKVCGLTRADDVEAAGKAGATHAGFILAPSKRRVSDLRDLDVLVGTAHDAGLLAVGVFVNEDVPEVLGIAKKYRLDVVQLHGDEAPEVVRAVRDAGLTVWKAVQAGPDFRTDSVDVFWDAGAEAVLIDKWHPKARGGTGEALDPAVAAAVALRGPTMLAGGMDGDNVGTLADQAQPWGVDASSKLESSPGIKDADKLLAYVEAARRQG